MRWPRSKMACIIIDENRLIDAMKQACKSVEQKQRELRNAHVKETAAERIYSECIRQVLHYVELNYQDPDISLKQIAENVLYMNVDYSNRNTACALRSI